MEDFYYRKLIAYQKAKELVTIIYRILKQFPAIENHALGSQIRRAAISVPSNIAEGMGRFALKERIHFIEIAYGSLMETMCQAEIALSLGYISDNELHQIETTVLDVAKTMSGLRASLINKLNNNPERK